ncbi:unnamed protein product [Moneuplotes crassus]|uniref:GP-PDE domain-containing protein n=1 Tax=Euplotes crassus TaxID=5936 RepID=A0AAD2CYD5_EUPCR|nr:unnamed protein product [Moneuplotes crassus]
MPTRGLKLKDTKLALKKHALVRLCLTSLLYFVLPSVLFYLLCVYVLVTEICFHFPNLVKKRKYKKLEYSKERFGFFMGAHRGGSLEGLENTMTNFKKAKELGGLYVEMDVCMTKDKKVVVIHDPHLKRISGIDKNVNDCNYAELPKIKDKVPVHFDWSNYDATNWQDKTFPLFDDVCKELGDTPINMEIKTNDDGILEEVYKIVKKNHKTSQVVWGTRRYEDSIKLSKMAPEVCRFACAKEFMSIYIGYIFGYLPFIDIDCDTVQLPLCTEGYKKCCTLEIKSALKRSLLLNFIKLTAYIVDPLLVHLQKRGVEPIFWVINRKEELEECLTYEGLSGIMTDCPEYFINLLEGKED